MIGPTMIGKIKLFTFLLILNIPSSIQQLIEQNVEEAPNTYEVLQDNAETEFEEIIPSNVIQIIDVKDDDHQVITNLNNMVISQEISNTHNDSELINVIQEESKDIPLEANGTVHVPMTLDGQQNGTNSNANNISASSQKASYTQSTTQQNVTTTKKDLSSINVVQNDRSSDDSQNNGLNSFIGRRIGDNSNVTNVTFTNPNVGSNYVINNTSDSGSNSVNASIVWRSDVPTKKTIAREDGNIKDIKNGTVINSLNNNTILIHNNDTISAEILDEAIDVVALINDTSQEKPSSLNDTIEDSEIYFRSDHSRLKHYVDRHIAKNKTQENHYVTKDINSKDRSLQANDSNSNLNSVFIIINSGNISGLHANISGKGHYNKFNSNITTDKADSKLLSSLINTSLNNLAGNIVNQNFKEIKSKNVFMIINSGTISNFQYNSQNSDEQISLKKENLESRLFSKNEAKGNFSIDKNNRIVDIKFRRNGNPDVESNNEKYNNDEEQNSLENEPLNTSTVTEVTNPSNEINGDQIQGNADSDLNNNNNFDIGQALFGIEPINPEFDLSNLNVLNGAIDILNRFKRSSNKKRRKYRNHKDDNETSKEKCNHLDCKKCKDFQKLHESGLNEISSEMKRSLEIARLIEKLKFNDSTDDVGCPLSIFFKLSLKQLYDKLSNSDNIILNILLPYLSYLMEDKDKIINLATQEIINLPFPIKIRLQLLQGDPTEMIKEILLYVNSILCQ